MPCYIAYNPQNASEEEIVLSAFGRRWGEKKIRFQNYERVVFRKIGQMSRIADVTKGALVF